MLTGAQLLSVTQPWDSVIRLSYLATMLQDTKKYLPFCKPGTVVASVTDMTLLFTKTRKKLCKHITEKILQMTLRLNGMNIFEHS